MLFITSFPKYLFGTFWLLLFATSVGAIEVGQNNFFDSTGIVAICKQDSAIILTNFADDVGTFYKECGVVKKGASFFNGGSYSSLNRSVFAKVKRLQKPDLMDFNANFDDFVYFNCEDVGKKVTIILRIYDTQPVAGHVPSDSYVPFNPFGTHVKDCQIDVMVMDNTAPTIRCPVDISINCVFYDFAEPLKKNDTDYFDSYFGRIITQDCDGMNFSNSFSYTDDNGNVVLGSNGSAFDICKAAISKSLSASFNCGLGVIKRTFQAIDAGGLKSMPCAQNITVISKIPIKLDTRIYRDAGKPAVPCDGKLRRRVGAIEDFVNDPLVSKDSIPMILWPDKLVELPTCVLFNTIGTSCDSTGVDAGYPTINTMEFCDQVSISYNDVVKPDTLGACIRITRNWVVRDTCQFGKKDTSWTYVQYITLIDQVKPLFTKGCLNDTVCSYPNDCFPTNVTLCAEAVDNCTPTNVLKYSYVIDINNNGTMDLIGKTACVAVNNANLALGSHSVVWSVEDNCGNVATCMKTFKVKDCSKPVAIAKSSTLDLSPLTCEATLVASKINQSSTDNCTPPNQLLFRVVKEKNWDPDFTIEQVLALPKEIIFTDTNVGANFVYLIAIDADKNWNYFRTLAVVNNSSNCTQKNIVSYTIQVKTENGLEIDSVDVYDNNVLRLSKFNTNNLLLYTADTLSHRFRLEKNRNFNNGVSTADLVAINKHILKIDTLQTPYKRIAADLNSDGKISTADMIELRKFILFLNEGSSIRSWKFLDKNYIFQSAQPEKESYWEYIDLDRNIFQASYAFVGVKMGDVNNSANPGKINGEILDRNSSKRSIRAIDQEVFAGQNVTLRMDVGDLMEQSGFQFCLQFDVTALTYLEQVGLPASSFNPNFIRGGLIPVSLLATEYGRELEFTFEAKRDGRLSDYLSFNPQVMVAESYDAWLTPSPLVLDFDHPEADVLFQNTPNPFENSTIIRFYLSGPSDAILTIFDQSGRELKRLGGSYSRGLHEIEISKENLRVGGIFFYKLTTDTFEDTKKMILLE